MVVAVVVGSGSRDLDGRGACGRGGSICLVGNLASGVLMGVVRGGKKGGDAVLEAEVCFCVQGLLAHCQLKRVGWEVYMHHHRHCLSPTTPLYPHYSASCAESVHLLLSSSSALCVPSWAESYYQYPADHCSESRGSYK